MGVNSRPNKVWKDGSPSASGALVNSAIPKKLGRGIEAMPSGPPREAGPVEQDHANDLAEAERDDGEIVAAQAQDRKAEHQARRRRNRPAKGRQIQKLSRSTGPAGHRNRRRRRRRRHSRGRAARPADDDVQAPPQHDVGQDQRGQVERRPVGEQHPRQGDGKGDAGAAPMTTDWRWTQAATSSMSWALVFGGGRSGRMGRNGQPPNGVDADDRDRPRRP